jgi:hypothetical protein
MCFARIHRLDILATIFSIGISAVSNLHRFQLALLFFSPILPSFEETA